MQNDKEYGYLLADISKFKKINNEKYQTLNEEKYKSQLDEAEKEKKKREAQRKEDHVTNPDLILDETLDVMSDLK
jgi:hypothetical protein